MNENQDVNFANTAHKDTKFSAIAQNWLFFHNVQTKLPTIYHGSLWNL